jgi:hypothetical protein
MIKLGTTIVIGLLALCGCRSVQPVLSEAPARVTQSLGDDRPAYLTNSVIEAAVSPKTGRIVYFGFVGGPNMLWVNPKAGNAKPGDWSNWGGDKVWLWPQTDWPRRGLKEWPPPGDPPAEPYHVRLTPRGLVMTSPVVPGFGVRIVRELSMPKGQPTLTIVNRVEVVDPALATDVALWTVTQIPPTDEVIATPNFARSPAGVNSPIYPTQMRESTEPWPLPQPSPLYPGDVVFKRPKTASAKVGLDADRLRVQIGDTFFTLRAAFSPTSGTLEPTERAQLYTQPATPDGVTAYSELEFTSPIWKTEDLRKGELVVTWSLWKPAK